MSLASTQPVAEDQDESLIRAMVAGDEGALAELMDSHTSWVRAVVYAVLGPCDEVDDVVQKVWLSVWTRADSIEDVSRWRYWVYRMAHNAAIDAGRKRSRRRTLWQRFGRSIQSAGNQTDERLKGLEVSEQHKLVLDAIHGLPDIYREPFVLRHLEDMSYREIARTMNLPVDTVETRLVRARRLLRESLASLK
ncbi:MAG: RNA polymerase sigma factor [Phycisphaeraceae bacterium]|nr:RNA polymerase sigma factor [Phycisphaeraceae bacterium]